MIILNIINDKCCFLINFYVFIKLYFSLKWYLKVVNSKYLYIFEFY
jgi:hypothetical protein